MAKRIEISEYGDPGVLRYVDFCPRDPAQGEVLIANKAIGINYIDVYVRNGLYAVPSLPSGLGNEGAGVIAKIGEGVNHVRIGDRVAYCQAPLGSYADYHTVSADKVVKLPDNISFEQAAAGLLKGLTVYYLLNLTYTPQPGEKILFHAAAGGVGLIAC